MRSRYGRMILTSPPYVSFVKGRHGLIKRYNGKAQPQWADGISFISSNVDVTTEQGKTVTPVVGCSGG